MERVIDSRKKSIPDRVGPSEPKSPCPARKYSSSPSARGRNRQRERKKVIASSRINARAVGDQFEFPTPRLSYREKAASPPRLPRVGARGGPVCRGQVRGSCPPGATLPTTGGSRCRDARGGDSADVIGRWLARGSAILWRSVDEQSVVPGRSRGTQESNDYVLLITLLVFVSRGLSNRSPLEVNNNQNLFYLFHKPIYDKHMYWVCVERNQAFLSFLPIFYSIFPIIFLRICTWSYCSIWTQSATVRHSVLYVQSVRNQPVLKFGPRVHLGPVVSFVSIPSCPPPPPSPGSSRLLSSPREHHGYIYGGVVRGQGQQEPPLSLLQPPRQSRRERATAAASPPPPSPPSSRDAPRAPPAPSSPPPRREATLRRAAAAEQQRGLQHTGTAAQQDEGVEETEAQDGPRWATPPTFLFTCFFLLFLLLFLIFSSTVLHPFFTFSTRFNMRTLFASVRLLGALYRHVALRDFFKFRGLSTILFRRLFRNVGFAMLTGLNRDNFLIFFFKPYVYIPYVYSYYVLYSLRIDNL